MASEFAIGLSRALTHGVPEDILEWGQGIIDKELQEVREVVQLAAHPKFDAGGDGVHYYLTKADIERARALMEKLEVRP